MVKVRDHMLQYGVYHDSQYMTMRYIPIYMAGQ